MCQGVIPALKAKYRSLAVDKLISALEKKCQPYPFCLQFCHVDKIMAVSLKQDLHQLFENSCRLGEGSGKSLV